MCFEKVAALMVLVVSQILTRLDLYVNPKDLNPLQIGSRITKNWWLKGLHINKRCYGIENDNYFVKAVMHVTFVAYVRYPM